jgi:hypothetical protein
MMRWPTTATTGFGCLEPDSRARAGGAVLARSAPGHAQPRGGLVLPGPPGTLAEAQA